MKQDNRLISIVMVILLGAMLQVVLAAGDSKDAPHSAAIEFSKAYFYMDADMADRLCNGGVTEDEVDMVGNYLYGQTMEAAARGFELKRLRKSFSHIATNTVDMTEDAATVNISGTTRTIINPVFGWVGKMFFITTSDTVETSLDVVREDGVWKVCGEPFALSAAVPEEDEEE